MRTQLSSEDSARIYKSAGGAYDRYDQTACVVHAGGGADRKAGLDSLAAGITMDSGISERSKTLYSSAVDDSVDANFKHLGELPGAGCTAEPVARVRAARQLPLQELPTRHSSPVRGRT